MMSHFSPALCHNRLSCPFVILKVCETEKLRNPGTVNTAPPVSKNFPCGKTQCLQPTAFGFDGEQYSRAAILADYSPWPFQGAHPTSTVWRNANPLCFPPESLIIRTVDTL